MASATMLLPILNGKNWVVRMQEIFGFQGVLEIVQRGIQEEEGSASYKESKKRDYKALFIIHQCVDEMNFWRISSAESAKEAWEILNKAHGGAVLNQAHTGAVKEKGVWMKTQTEEVRKNVSEAQNTETEGKQNENQEEMQRHTEQFPEIRVLGNSSLASDDEPNTAPTEHNQTPQPQEPEFSNLGISEIRVFRKSIFATEEEEQSATQNKNCENQFLGGPESRSNLGISDVRVSVKNKGAILTKKLCSGGCDNTVKVKELRDFLGTFQKDLMPWRAFVREKKLKTEVRCNPNRDDDEDEGEGLLTLGRTRQSSVKADEKAKAKKMREMKMSRLRPNQESDESCKIRVLKFSSSARDEAVVCDGGSEKTCAVVPFSEYESKTTQVKVRREAKPNCESSKIRVLRKSTERKMKKKVCSKKLRRRGSTEREKRLCARDAAKMQETRERGKLSGIRVGNWDRKEEDHCGSRLKLMGQAQFQAYSDSMHRIVKCSPNPNGLTGQVQFVEHLCSKCDAGLIQSVRHGEHGPK